MITTITIEKLCLQEEGHWPDAEWKQERRQWLIDALEAGRYGDLEKDFGWIGTERVEFIDRIQLACEATKFHDLRLDGHDLHRALDRMVGP